jgi:hypothetical protein
LKEKQKDRGARPIFLQIVVISSVLIMGAGFLLAANSLVPAATGVGPSTNATSTVASPNDNAQSTGDPSVVPGNLSLVVGFLAVTAVIGTGGVFFLRRERKQK